MRCGVPAVALSRVGARVAGSGPGGEELAAGTWQRLEALPDPRSPRGRIYPLACLVAIAVRAFTSAKSCPASAWRRKIRHQPSCRLSQQAPLGMKACRMRDGAPARPGCPCCCGWRGYR